MLPASLPLRASRFGREETLPSPPSVTSQIPRPQADSALKTAGQRKAALALPPARPRGRSEPPRGGARGDAPHARAPSHTQMSHTRSLPNPHSHSHAHTPTYTLHTCGPRAYTFLHRHTASHILTFGRSLTLLTHACLHIHPHTLSLSYSHIPMFTHSYIHTHLGSQPPLKLSNIYTLHLYTYIYAHASTHTLFTSSQACRHIH